MYCILYNKTVHIWTRSYDGVRKCWYIKACSLQTVPFSFTSFSITYYCLLVLKYKIINVVYNYNLYYVRSGYYRFSSHKMINVFSWGIMNNINLYKEGEWCQIICNKKDVGSIQSELDSYWISKLPIISGIRQWIEQSPTCMCSWEVKWLYKIKKR